MANLEQTTNELQSCLDDLVFRTHDEPKEVEELKKVQDTKKRNEMAVDIVVNNFRKLLEQSKVLE